MTPEIPEMTCAACRELLPWQTAGRLPPDERAAVERHLTGCAECQREASQWRDIARALAGDERAIPPDGGADAGWQALRDRLEPHAPMVVAQKRPSTPLADAAAPTLAASNARTPRRFGRPTLAAPAVVILVALIAALFVGFGSRLRQARTPAVSATATPSACAPAALRATIPAHARMGELSMTSARSGWAVGSIVTGANLANPSFQTLLLRFEQCQWTPFGDGIASAELDSVSMISATDGWAVGETHAGVDGADNALLALHYSGGVWQQVSVPAAPSGVVGAKVRMTSAGDGWMLLDMGGRHVTPYQKQYSYTLLHLQNGVWTPVPLSFDQSGTSILWDIATNSADDCWIVGYGSANTFDVAHYHQGAWTSWTDTQLGVRYAALYAVALVAPDDVWVAGSYPYHDATGDHTGPLVLHFDGEKWTRAPLSDYQDETNDHAIMALAVQPSGGVWAFTQGLAAPTSPMLFAHDANEANGGNGAWTWAAGPSHTVAMFSVVFVSDGEAFGLARIGSGWSGWSPTSAILHYSNGVWSVAP